jgi:hypothetical protein
MNEKTDEIISYTLTGIGYGVDNNGNSYSYPLGHGEAFSGMSGFSGSPNKNNDIIVDDAYRDMHPITTTSSHCGCSGISGYSGIYGHSKMDGHSGSPNGYYNPEISGPWPGYGSISSNVVLREYIDRIVRERVKEELAKYGISEKVEENDDITLTR